MNDVTVYSSNKCVYCVILKNFLRDQNIEFKEINVDEKPDIVQKLIMSSGQMGIPQTEVNGKWVVGYKPDAIMNAIND
ncbi:MULTISPECIES: glutaredoxin family protein [Bacillus]|uniref:glutaredoxin family protein n=1 Tax=Bacillus TaxID=1386 RepID=UPI000314C9E4|nr:MULTISPECIES: glutaredoxin family protein [Bacillus]